MRRFIQSSVWIFLNLFLFPFLSIRPVLFDLICVHHRHYQLCVHHIITGRGIADRGEDRWLRSISSSADRWGRIRRRRELEAEEVQGSDGDVGHQGVLCTRADRPGVRAPGRPMGPGLHPLWDAVRPPRSAMHMSYHNTALLPPISFFFLLQFSISGNCTFNFIDYSVVQPLLDDSLTKFCVTAFPIRERDNEDTFYGRIQKGEYDFSRWVECCKWVHAHCSPDSSPLCAALSHPVRHFFSLLPCHAMPCHAMPCPTLCPYDSRTPIPVLVTNVTWMLTPVAHMILFMHI